MRHCFPAAENMPLCGRAGQAVVTEFDRRNGALSAARLPKNAAAV